METSMSLAFIKTYSYIYSASVCQVPVCTGGVSDAENMISPLQEEAKSKTVWYLIQWCECCDTVGTCGRHA